VVTPAGTQKSVASTLVESIPPAPASTTPVSEDILMEGTADSAMLTVTTKEDALPAAGQEGTEAGKDELPPIEQEAAAARGREPPAEDQMTTAAGEDTTGLSPGAYAEVVRRMDEVVGELPPIPLKLLVLSFLSGDAWKQSKTPEANDQEKVRDQPHPEAPAGASTTVSTRRS
jgi:hypothetical protein